MLFRELRYIKFHFLHIPFPFYILHSYCSLCIYFKKQLFIVFCSSGDHTAFIASIIGGKDKLPVVMR